MSDTPEHDKRTTKDGEPVHADVAAARAYELEVRGTSNWLHQARVGKAQGLREAFLAGISYARAADPSMWARGYAEFEEAFCQVLGLEGNVPPAVARQKLKDMQRDLDELRAVVARGPAPTALVPAEAPPVAENGCPACGAARTASRGYAPNVWGYACGSVTRSYHDTPSPMFTQSVPCVRAQMSSIHDLIRKSCCGG